MNRHTTRLKDYDYSKEGLYFVTICTKNKENIFGEIINGSVKLNNLGMCVLNCWKEIPNHFNNVILHNFVVMPNHVHGILEIKNIDTQNVEIKIVGVKNIGVQNIEPLQQPKTNKYQHIIPKSLGSIVRGFKIGVTKWAREHTEVYSVWQRNYYENIIRNEEIYIKVSEYIENNPLKWEEDRFFV